MADRLQKPWTVILGWFIANLLAVAFVALVPYIFPPVLRLHGGMLVSSLIVGFPIGLAQWIALRRVAPISVLWIFSISLALPLGLTILNSPIFLGGLSLLDDESIIAFMIGYAVIGLVVGLIQWVFLRSHFAKPLVWPPVSAAGLGLGMGLVLAMISPSGIAPVILGVLVYALATGAVISRTGTSSADDEATLPSAA